jgi:hypothetical protein
MEQKRLRVGHVLALVGALAALCSLWRPWYAIEVPQQLRDLMSGSGRLGSDPGLFGEMARGLAAALPASISASGWRELEGGDVVVCVAVVVAVALVLGAAGAFGTAVRVDPAGAGTAIAAIGVVVLGVAVVHLVHRPGGAAAADYVHVADGVWVALAGGAAMVAGGLLAAQPVSARGPAAPVHPRLEPELPPVFTAGPGAAASVPPPSR